MPPDNEVEVDPAELEHIDALLRELSAEDLEFLEPPTAIWNAILAAVDAERDAARLARTAPGLRHSDALTVAYRINADDCVISMGDGWLHFARDNGAPELAELNGTQTLWSFFSSDTSRNVWQMIIERVRNSGDAMQVPLRCDAPHARRWFEMTVSPEAGEHVHFQSVLVFEELREPVAFLDAFVERDATDDEIAVCTWCAQAEYEGEWREVEDVVRRARLLERAVMPPVVHGVCSACRDELSRECSLAGTDEADG
ncbi:MAG TPA: hypothetical protein DCE75_11585 [Acidimicrobiaceae bacterium]|nr:hypothetical protein [Acidimicrobiaceae bacterium]